MRSHLPPALRVMVNDAISLIGMHNFISTEVVSIKICFCVELFMFFALHDYYDINIIFLVFVSL